jgi:cell division protein DivIC
LSFFFLLPKCIIFEPKQTEVENKSQHQKIWIKAVKNKYFIASVLFLTWIVFFDENSFVSHAENKRRLNELNKQKEYYMERIEADKQKLEDLNAGKKELEKFAREQYYMSNPDEDLFIVIEEE